MEDPLVTPTARDPRHHRHHPWRVFSTYTDWKLEWRDWLPEGRWGWTRHHERKVYLLNGLDEAERRCTIAHETQHIIRGPYPQHLHMREELIINRRVGRLLVPSVKRIGHAMAWAQADYEKAAYDLWVDDETFDIRLNSLTPRERAQLAEHLETIFV